MRGIERETDFGDRGRRRVDAEAAAVAARREAIAAWVIVTVPGMLLTRAVVTLALIALAWLQPLDFDPRLLGAVGAAYLATQTIASLGMIRGSARVTLALCCALLAVDAAIAGLLLGSNLAWRGAGGGVAVVAMGLAVAAIGWRGVLLTGCVIAAMGGANEWIGRTPGRPAAGPAFSPALSVERSFAAARLTSPGQPSVAGVLSVETSFIGTPLRAGDAAAFSPVLDVERSFSATPAGARADTAGPRRVLISLFAAALALVAGNVASLIRSRRARTAVAAALLANGRVAL